ncbi:MAG TPA: zinc-dependent metalloprotease [Gemmatimonadaceae bacterium]
MRTTIVRISAVLTAAIGASLGAQQPQGGAPPAAGPGAQTPTQGPGAGRGNANRPRPYNQVVTDRAVSDAGGITVHKIEDRYLFEVPDTLLGRDFLLVSRIAGVPANVGGFLSAGTSVGERLVRWERSGDRLSMRSISVDAVADDSLPIAISVASNNVGAILMAFPIQAYGRAGSRDSATFVVDVTEFFGGDTPTLSGLSAAQRRTYQVRRLDPARSFVTAVRSFPLNVEVRHTQTFDAAEPPGDQRSGALSLEMRQSLVLLPRVPMRPRLADARAGFFTVDRVNYGLDVLKAQSETFIRRWRLEPKDPAAYARGELVEPIKPIVYYLDPATPTRWRTVMKQGVEDWQKAFEKAGFKNAIIARDAPTPEEDPEWDPEDIRYSVVRWAASLVRNAVGPSTSDPRSGEIIESDITWFHNHMRSYRNRLLIETGASNPAARTLDTPEELMGETMRKVVTHEVGHALGLPHNMVASSSFPTDSLRKASFTRRYGVSATIMDYARQNYVAQPGDGLEPKDYIRRLGPFDDFIINWGYRVLPNARTPQEEKATLNKWLSEQTGPMPYRYVEQFYSGVDPRAQTEDLGDDPVKSSTYAVANLKRVVPNLVQWTTKGSDDYTELTELYGETVGMWSQYMGHVATLIGGVYVDNKTADQSGAVYRPVPKAQQKAALDFLAENVFKSPDWLAPASITSRLGPPSGATSLVNRQANVIVALLNPGRLGRLADSEVLDARAYPVAEYLADVKRAVWGSGAAPMELDAGRRTMQRVYIERLEALISPPAPPPAAAGAPPGGPAAPPGPFLATPNVPRSDFPALARAQVRAIREQARASALAAPAGSVARAHWQDIVDRTDKILDPGR